MAIWRYGVYASADVCLCGHWAVGNYAVVCQCRGRPWRWDEGGDGDGDDHEETTMVMVMGIPWKHFTTKVRLKLQINCSTTINGTMGDALISSHHII